MRGVCPLPPLLLLALLFAVVITADNTVPLTLEDFEDIVHEVSPDASIVERGRKPAVQCPDVHALSRTTKIWYKIHKRTKKWSPYGPNGPWEDVTENIPVVTKGDRFAGRYPVQCNINIINRLARGRPLVGAASRGETIPSWCVDKRELRRHNKRSNGNTVAQRCEFYTSCLEPLYKCGSNTNDPNSYPVNYGKKYCHRFLERTFTKMRSKAGRVFIDKTLQCLQEELIPWVQRRKGSCKELTDYAFDSHPSCYTQTGSSICKLLGFSLKRKKDLLDISGTVEGQDILTLRSARQMAAVARTCAGDTTRSVPDALRGFWDNITS